MKKYLLIIGLAGWTSASAQNIYQWMRTFEEVIRHVRDNYVQEVEFKDLFEAAIRGMLQKLDPHSTYLTQKQYQELRIHTTGKYGGLGFTVGKVKNVITVISPFEGTPAYRAGIQPGDRIIKIDAIPTKSMELDEAVDKMRGTPGTKVTLTIEREGIEKPIDFQLTRETIEIENVKYYGIINPNVGYIRLSGFSQNAGKEVGDALDSLIVRGANKFIIDLRTNPGGLLEEAVSVADNFLPIGKLVVATKGRGDKTNREFYSTREPKINNLPVVVLVNGASASASEIVAGAIQDWDIGVVVGDTTFGKGSVQTVIPLQTGAVKLTTAMYYTPSGRCINREDTLVYLLKNPTVGKKFTTVGELKRALSSEGAIIPDRILEKIKPYPEFIVKAEQEGLLIEQWASKYVREHKELAQEFDVSPAILQEFKLFMRNKGIKFTEQEFDSATQTISELLKERIAETKWGTEGKYKVMLAQDPWIREAVALISKANSTKELFKVASTR